MGADAVVVRGPDLTKIWLWGLLELWLGTPRNFTETNLISTKSRPGAAL